MGQAILYIKGSYLSDWNEFETLAVQSLTSTSTENKDLQQEILASFRDGTAFEWAISRQMPVSSKLNPDNFDKMTDRELMTIILNLCGHNEGSTVSLDFNEYLNFCDKFFIITEDGKEEEVIFNPNHSYIRKSVIGIKVGFKVKEIANDVIEISVQEKTKTRIVKDSKKFIISLMKKDLIYQTIPIKLLKEWTYIVFKCGNKIINTIKFLSAPSSGVVDMGTSVLWATCNFGAMEPSLFGDYYSWKTINKIEEKSESANNYNIHRHNIISRKMGAGWIVPTLKDWEDLLKVSYMIPQRNSICLKSRITNNVLIFPLSGLKSSENDFVPRFCNASYLWTSTLSPNCTNNNAWAIFINPNSSRFEEKIFEVALNIRPVFNPNSTWITTGKEADQPIGPLEKFWRELTSQDSITLA